MNFQDNIRYKFNQFGVVEKLIAVNVAVFLLFIILDIAAYLFQAGGWIEDLTNWLIVPRNLDRFITRPWTVFTYAFMHAGFWHILSNMIILYFSGRFFLTFFSPKRLLNYYFLGALAGALLFLVSYNLFPVFADGHNYTLIGASAAVMAILVGVATYAPNMAIRFFMFNIKLWWIAAFFVIKDFVMIPIENPGGHIAHIGGAALGYIYTTQLAKGKDIGAWFEKIMDGLVGLFQKPTKAKSPFRKVYKNKSNNSAKTYKSTASAKQNASTKQKKIDEILDKISKNGYDSLSKEEKDFLFSAGND